MRSDGDACVARAIARAANWQLATGQRQEIETFLRPKGLLTRVLGYQRNKTFNFRLWPIASGQ